MVVAVAVLHPVSRGLYGRWLRRSRAQLARTHQRSRLQLGSSLLVVAAASSMRSRRNRDTLDLRSFARATGPVARRLTLRGDRDQQTKAQRGLEHLARAG